jgi:hypothetical protein
LFILLYQDKVVKYESDSFSALSYRFSVRLYRKAKSFHPSAKTDDGERKPGMQKGRRPFENRQRPYSLIFFF